MLPEIGFMVGCYIITKLTYICGLQETKTPALVMSGVTILVTVVVCIDLLTRGLSGATGLK